MKSVQALAEEKLKTAQVFFEGFKLTAAADNQSLRDENEHMKSEFEAYIRALHAEYAAKMSEATRELMEQGHEAILQEREATVKAQADSERYRSVAETAEAELRHLQATSADDRRQFEEKVRHVEAENTFQIGRVNEMNRALDEATVNAGVLPVLQANVDSLQSELTTSEGKVAAAEVQMGKYQRAQESFEKRTQEEAEARKVLETATRRSNSPTAN